MDSDPQRIPAIPIAYCGLIVLRLRSWLPKKVIGAMRLYNGRRQQERPNKEVHMDNQLLGFGAFVVWFVAMFCYLNFHG